MAVRVLESREPDEPHYCDFCGSDNPIRRGLVHRRKCFHWQAWDIEGSCTCGNPYLCRGRFHPVNRRKKGKP